MSDINFETIKDGTLQKWDNPGTKVVGILKSYRPQKTNMGEGNVYEVQTKDGLVPFFAPQLLHRKLQEVAVGNIVSIEYTKKTKTGGGTDLKHFEVGQALPNEANLAALGISVLKPVDFDDFTEEKKAE